MDSLNLTEHNLTRNVPLEGFTGTLSHSNGLVACLHPRTREFVTSPNSSTIPIPPFGSTRNLYRREDGLFGPDDPVQTPQPFNHRNLYLAWIPCPPSDENHPYISDSNMWVRISTYDMEFTAQGTPRNEGVLRKPLGDSLEQVVHRLRERSRQFKQAGVVGQINVSQLIQEFDNTLTICLNRVRNVSMSFKDIQLGVSELRRAWSYTVVLLDWLEQSNANANSIHYPEHRMGAFIWTDRDALFLQHFGLPVYYVRPYGTFDRQIILTVKPFRKPFIYTMTATPPYPVLLANAQAGHDTKFTALRAAAARCFSTASPFENMHLPGAYSSSYSQGSAGKITSSTHSHPLSTSASSSTGGVNRSTPSF
ncbi:hypothetical protein PM082_015663 [Marasmius tenuissimus]|nr:hypothetical protein PM082_015663 [Marasmius tenuissimus]